MQLTKQQKNDLVLELKGNINKASSIVIWNHNSIPVNEFNKLRQLLKDNSCVTKVYKNTLTKKAFEEEGYPEFKDGFTGVSSVAFSFDENVNVSKIIHDELKKLKKKDFLRAGLVDGQFIGIDGIEDIATLPSKPELLSMLLSVLQAPIKNFAYLTKEIANKKEQ